ncbi:hypothetical protein Glove_136g98 [Diversispora epigaea]|uniref:Uncharacterized protein n=1 Tax=Diversispora epigaea TaxID=1348612 RepID=A0A397IWQ6_9GLOM|nr:hypothetical protein Glove_136g98 [Diversispora epigaea]
MSLISEYKSKNIQWESTWRTTMLSDISHNIIDNKDTRKRAFNVKMLNNELPSLEKLQDRFPLVYHTNICPRCLLEEETQSHIFTCTKNKIDIYTCRNKLFQLIVNKTTAVSCGDSCKDFKNELINIEDLNIPTKFTTCDLNHLSFIDVILDQVMDEVMNQFKLFIYENIWKERCSLVREWERNVGIGNDRKKQKCCQQTSDTDVLSVKNHGDLVESGDCDSNITNKSINKTKNNIYLSIRNRTYETYHTIHVGSQSPFRLPRTSPRTHKHNSRKGRRKVCKAHFDFHGYPHEPTSLILEREGESPFQLSQTSSQTHEPNYREGRRKEKNQSKGRNEELNKLISELAEVYSSKVREIVQKTSSFNTSQLKELQYIRKQLNLLFQIRDNCLKVLEDLELLNLYSSLSY